MAEQGGEALGVFRFLRDIVAGIGGLYVGLAGDTVSLATEQSEKQLGRVEKGYEEQMGKFTGEKK